MTNRHTHTHTHTHLVCMIFKNSTESRNHGGAGLHSFRHRGAVRSTCADVIVICARRSMTSSVFAIPVYIPPIAPPPISPGQLRGEKSRLCGRMPRLRDAQIMPTEILSNSEQISAVADGPARRAASRESCFIQRRMLGVTDCMTKLVGRTLSRRAAKAAGRSATFFFLFFMFLKTTDPLTSTTYHSTTVPSRPKVTMEH